MRIEIPTAALQFALRSHEKSSKRAQIYNYDDNERFDLQFWPNCRPHETDQWAQKPWLGTPYEHRQFLSSGGADFEIPIELLVDPGAPRIANQNTTPSVVDSYGLVDIENVIRVIGKWAQIRPDLGRSSLIGYISNSLTYVGVMTAREFEEIDRFPDGRLKHMIIRIGFQRWRTPSRPV